MGRKSNFEKKRDIVLELLKNLKKNLNGKTYRSYEDDIRFKKNDSQSTHENSKRSWVDS